MPVFAFRQLTRICTLYREVWEWMNLSARAEPTLPVFLIRERTNAGLAAARARGRVGGRPRKLKSNGKVVLARQMFDDQSHSIPEICAALGISHAMLYRYVREAKEVSSLSNS